MTLLYVLAYLYVFWLAYVLVMGIYRAKLAHRLHGFVLLLSWPVVLVGLVLDILANLTLAMLIFLDLPREWLVTDRLQRYVAQKTGWRADFANWVCNNLLDPFDPTNQHC